MLAPFIITALLLVCYGNAYNLNAWVKICTVQYYTNNKQSLFLQNLLHSMYVTIR